jgi:hypothetical protein
MVFVPHDLKTVIAVGVVLAGVLLALVVVVRDAFNDRTR